ncbi:MAG: DUF1365 domain-containing protein [Rhodospirillaceae bacterium]|nr:DUF1365 domain-containing protein [Rhodospirillaceae bacterium]
MTAREPALYTGAVMHRRFSPRPHRFRYRGFWLLVDVDRLPEMRLATLSHNRFNLFSLLDRDHGDGSDRPLGDQTRTHLAAHGIDLSSGSITLLCMPRTLGYSFNPLSIYFCRYADGRPAALIYEVHNTFGERHSYVLPAAQERTHHSCDKRFYVSPFLEMDLMYDFTVAFPEERLAISIQVRQREAPVMSACVAAKRRSLTDGWLLICFFLMPVITLKVVAAIHWEALRLWYKGFRLVPRSTASNAISGDA